MFEIEVEDNATTSLWVHSAAPGHDMPPPSAVHIAAMGRIMTEYPVGYRQFHPSAPVNYQLNRWLVVAEEEEFAAAANKIQSLADWIDVFLKLGERAASEGRFLHASTYYRAAEFFTPFEDPSKLRSYELYRQYFDKTTIELEHEAHLVPFGSGHLPTIHFKATGKARDTVLLHGGFDSYMEEFTSQAQDLVRAGFEIILFEGPGQGAALRRHGLTMSPEWEKPTGAILDYFHIDKCTLIGLSLGGYLAPRAAAFDNRIKRVVLWNQLTDFLACFSAKVGQHTVDRILRLLETGREREVNSYFAQLIGSQDPTGWAVAHGMHISGSKSPSEYIRWLSRMSTASFSSKIKQDVLILTGTEDHIVPLSQLYDQMRTLTRARSVSVHIFSAQEDAHNHCQVGNNGLAIDVILNWLDLMLRNEMPKAPVIENVGQNK